MAVAADKSMDWIQTSIGSPASFVMSMARDLQGRVWIGTEDEGVFCLDSAATDGQMTNYTAENGLGDDSAYAIACDKLGRIWVGTLNHGVSVYNGVRWQNYSAVADKDHNILAGPLGDRVFAIAISPVDGDVWIATDAGLTRYSVQKDSWSYITQDDGLPSDQTSSLAFASDGTLYVGTQCDGIAIAGPNDNYQAWRVVTGPEQLPMIAEGSGLPGCLVNCLLVQTNGTVLAGTNGGLASSSDKGKTWQFIRGQDYPAKVNDGYPPVSWQNDTDITDESLMPEDHITSLAQDNQGRIWIGTWRKGFEVFDAPLLTALYTGGFTKSKQGTGKFITAILPLGNDQTIVASYGTGVAKVGDDSNMPDNGVPDPLDPSRDLPDVLRRHDAGIQLQQRLLQQRIEHRPGLAPPQLRRLRCDDMLPTDFGRIPDERVLNAARFCAQTRFHFSLAGSLITLGREIRITSCMPRMLFKP